MLSEIPGASGGRRGGSHYQQKEYQCVEGHLSSLGAIVDFSRDIAMAGYLNIHGGGRLSSWEKRFQIFGRQVSSDEYSVSV